MMAVEKILATSLQLFDEQVLLQMLENGTTSQ